MITLIEIVYFCIATAVVGYIFTGFVRTSSEDSEEDFGLGPERKRFNWQDFKFACAVAGPAIVAHELAHKLVAMGFGLAAKFSVWWLGLALGVILKMIGSGFILVAPGYVGIGGGAAGLGPGPGQVALIALAGPLVNLVLWISAGLWLKKARALGRKKGLFLILTKEVNKWLFIFNMLPIPPLDGGKVLFSVLSMV